MVVVKEYRVVLPCTVDEYQVGQLFSVAEASKDETGGGEGIEVLKNEPYEENGQKGQYTHKIYHIQSRVPGYVRTLAPSRCLKFHEKAWNAYPYCKTVVTNEFLKDDFLIQIETWHKEDLEAENVHGVKDWESVEKVNIDITDGSVIPASDYKAEEDPAKFKSVKTGRGPLGPDWMADLKKNPVGPRMCAYKLVTAKFKWWGLQNRVEDMIHRQEKKIFTKFHRQVFCWLDKWVDLTMEDIRDMEEATKKELDDLRGQGDVRGTKVQE